MENTVAYLSAPSRFTIGSASMPAVGEEDLLIEVKHVGICGSDIQVFSKPETCMHAPVYPVILGHECAGVVVGMGAQVQGFSLGDKVAVEPGVPCRRCRYCLSGHYNLCEKMNFMACYPWERAALQRYITHPALMCFKLPDNVSTLEGALMEPFSVGMYAAARAEAGPDKTAVILGVGCIGLMTLSACKARGAWPLIAADLFENRLAMAAETGADHALNAGDPGFVDKVMELTGRGADLVFETAGSAATVTLAQKLVRPGGQIILVGNVAEPVSIRFMELSERQIDIVSVFRYCNMYPQAIAAAASKRVDLSGMVSARFPLERVQEAFEYALYEKKNVIKAVVEL
ncbi:MAG: NAD(P)-dependent alcohol dehydrogenase [Candidatus Pelethousia sp.]|nr:NAD(P)-dependent alcohol dehydrogenase [Candidatus Pelethousia sp.]